MEKSSEMVGLSDVSGNTSWTESNDICLEAMAETGLDPDHVESTLSKFDEQAEIRTSTIHFSYADHCLPKQLDM